MLKYTINNSEFRSQLKKIELEEYELVNLYGSSDDKCLLICYYMNECNVSDNLGVFVCNRINLDNNNNLNTSTYESNETMYIAKVNEEKRLFTIVVDRYFDLDLTSLTETVVEEEGGQVIYWRLYFDSEGHLFTSNDETIIVYVEYDYYDENGIANTGLDELKCTYVSPNLLKIVYTDDMAYLRSAIYDEYYESFNVTSIKVYRDTPFFNENSNFEIYLDNPLCNIQIPISSNFETDLMLGYGIQESFVDAEKKAAINSIVDMEKDAYVPVIWDSDAGSVLSKTSGNNIVNGEVYSIDFNLHFRQHRGDDWLVNSGVYWNGVIDVNGRLRFIDDYYSGVTFFSLSDKSSQSDLLTYLDFSNDDVRYQKNRLRRSFLRLMFYDSTNPGDQNLLYYSTIFFDSGDMFSKYIRRVSDTPYRAVVYDEDDEGNETINTTKSRTNLIGLKVDREPYGTLVEGLDDDDIDELRLSSRLTVEDKYDSISSSEGFYLYLWKDNDNGVTPTDLYMKVEFNHAGYGRTIPFMMPFYDEKVDGQTGIKTFEEILTDWSNDDTKYNVRKYLKYSYIHLKYRYDKVNKRHVYYLDDTFYGDGVRFENNKITFNLYEAKII